MRREPHLPFQPPVWVLWAVPVLGVLGVIPLWWLWLRAYWGVVGEDHLAEWLTFIAYVAAAVLAAAVATQLVRARLPLDTALFVCLGAGFVFVAGEEVSWFQRQLGFAGPQELVARNVQNEANLHNLLERPALHAVYIGVALYACGLARWVVPRVPHLRRRPWLYVPPPSLWAWFGCALVYYVWADYLDPVLTAVLGNAVQVDVLTGPKLQEVVELSLGGGFALFLLRLLRLPDLTSVALERPASRTTADAQA